MDESSATERWLPVTGYEGCYEVSDLVSNLRWDTRSENNYDKVRHGTDHKKNRLRCPSGHLLRAPNLTRDREKVRRGHRKCLACARAHNNQRYALSRGRFFDFQVAADRHYRSIMAGEVDDQSN